MNKIFVCVLLACILGQIASEPVPESEPEPEPTCNEGKYIWNEVVKVSGMNDSEILTDSDSDSDSHIFH